MTPQPFVSVIMPVRNAMPYLAPTLDALLGGNYPADRMEVVVADGGSTDGTRPTLALYAANDARLRWVHSPVGTTPAGLNRALGVARGEIIVRLDAHAVPAPDYVAACVAALRRTGADAVGGPQRPRGRTPFGAAVAAALRSPLGHGGAAYRAGGEGPADTVYLGAWPRATFDRVGWFDTALARNQDYELCVRIRDAGGTVWLDPAIRTLTWTRDGALGLARQYFEYGVGRAATVVRHPASLAPRQAVPAVVFLAATLTGVLDGWRSLRWLVAGYAAANATASWRAAAAEPAAVARRIPAALAIMHVCWASGFWVGLARALAGGPSVAANRARAPQGRPG
jgi:hypothetical protein